MEKDELTDATIGAAIEVHKILGPGLLEAIYEKALCHEFEIREIAYERQVSIDVIYKGKNLGGQIVDIVVEKKVSIELKSLKALPAVAISQTLSNLKATGLRRALLINFGEKTLVHGLKRISL
jgi:GxxExxY protein